MKKIILIFTFLYSITFFAQFNENAPWISKNEQARESKKTINDLVTLFDEYWKTNDKSIKGSGYKPFMRWQEHWQNKVNAQGFLMTPDQMWAAYNFKQSKVNQRNNATLNLPVSNWQPVGPFTHTNTGSWSSGQGRVNTILVDPSNPNTIFMGTPAGGIWKSTNSGNSWLPMSDNLPQIGVSGIAVDYSNPNTIYIATGDNDGTDTYSVGVLKSIDGGVTWNTTGLSFFDTDTFAGDIIIHPTNSNMLWVATNLGIYKTVNAGVSWDLVQSGNFSQGRIRLKTNDSNVVYAVSEERFYRSTNAGQSFNVITTGLPANSGRMILDVTPANPDCIYILSANTSYGFQGVYRSLNGGTSWTKTSGTTNVFESTQAWFDLALAVSATDANEIYTGCLNVWKSNNGGVNFTKINSWSQPFEPAYTHADIHFLRFYNNKLFCGSDGGIYVSEDNASSFTDKTGTAQIGQFYKVAVSKQSASKMVGGLQDNGGYAYSNNQWKNYYGADGMDTAIHPSNSNKYYGFIQSGGSMYISNDGGNSLASSVGAPSGQTGNWVTPLVINSQGELFSGYKNLYKLNESNWALQSTTTFNNLNIDYISIDPTNDDIMYVAVNTNLYKSTNRGITFGVVYSTSFDITSIDVHSSNGNIVYVTTRTIDGEVLKSIDGGNSFSSISEGLPLIGKNIIVHQDRNPDNPLYLGTSLGVFYRDDSMAQWEPFDANLPNVSITDLEVNLEDAILTAATYGRGIWQTPIPVVAPQNDIKITDITNPTAIGINCTPAVNPEISIKNNGLNPINQVIINYSFNATNNSYTWNGNLAPGATTSVALPTQNLPKGAYDFNVISTINNDAYADNNTAQSVFYLNSPGTPNVTNTFENTLNELLENDEGSATGLWTRGIRSNGILATGTNNVYATSLSGTYPNLTKSYLYSECYNLSQISNPQMSFKLAYDLEENWDILYVQYSTDGGTTWEVLGYSEPNWYNSDRTPETTGSDCNNCVGAQWTGTNATLATYSQSLSFIGNQTNVIFRFVFHSDPAVVEDGVVIDDFLISGTLSNQEFELNNLLIYPNPSNGIFNIAISKQDNYQVEVYDVLGKQIFSKQYNQVNDTIFLDLSDASIGVYFVKIKSNNQIVTKKITKK